MVIRIGAGEVGPSVSQLVKDVRAMMEPGTASRLKERRSNRLRDYTAMAGPLGVSHLLLFSRSTTGNTNLRLALTPRGPTLHFRVEKYSLSKDVKSAQKHAQGGGNEFLAAPLLVMNNFISQQSLGGDRPKVPKHLETLTTTIFQSLFPPIAPQSTPLSSIRRVMLLNRENPKGKDLFPAEEGIYILNLRHYAITTKRTGLSRGVRRLNAAEKMLKQKKRSKGRVPDLGKLEDVADYLLDPAAARAADDGFTSGSDSEVETDAEVEILKANARKVLNKKQMATMRRSNGDEKQKPALQPGVEKRAVKLMELGPRMKLRMTKVEEGVCEGKVMWHEFLEKTPEEINEMEGVWEARRKEKAERKRLQKENLERKRKENDANSKDVNEKRNAKEEQDENDEMYEDEWDSEGLEGDGEVETNEDEDDGMENA